MLEVRSSISSLEPLTSINPPPLPSSQFHNHRSPLLLSKYLLVRSLKQAVLSICLVGFLFCEERGSSR